MSITEIKSNSDFLTFTINLKVCFINAIRRIILSDIPSVCFITSPESKNTLIIDTNTSGLNNEIIKQRFSCIPIHIKTLTGGLENMEVQIDVKNETTNILNVTTKDIKIFDTNANSYMSDADVNKIFPPDEISGDHILICRLRPTVGDIPGEHLKCKSILSVSTASNLGCYNVAHTCSYKFAKDTVKQQEKWLEIQNTIIGEGDTPEIIEQKKQNWLLGEGTKIVIPDTFHFSLGTVGVYTNNEIIISAIDILINKFSKYEKIVDLNIKATQTIMKNGYDIVIKDDYSVGYIMQYILYDAYFDKTPLLSYVGFKKIHPHDKYSVLKMGFKNNDDYTKERTITLIQQCSQTAIEILVGLKSQLI